MANPSEPTTERAAAAIRALLAGISAGSTYWYTPERVAMCAYFDESWLEGLGGPVYLIRAGEERVREDTTSQVEIATDFHILVAVKSETATDNPFLLQDGGETGRSTVLNRVIRDVIQRLLTDPTLGGIAINVMHETARVDREFFLMGDWLCAEITTTVLTLPLKTSV